MSDKPNKKSLVKAATTVTNIVVAGTAGVAAVALHSWAIAAVGGAALAALTAWGIFGKKELEAAGPRLADASDFDDPHTRIALQSIKKARVEIDKVLGDTSAEVQAHLAMVVVSVGELEERASKLAVRAEDIAKYLATVDPAQLQKDVDALDLRAKAARDKEARAQYEAARSARAQHLATVNDLFAAKERIAASLLSIAATMDALPAKIVRMRALDAQAMDQLTGDVKDELDRMNVEIQSFEETLTTLGDAARGV